MLLGVVQLVVHEVILLPSSRLTDTKVVSSSVVSECEVKEFHASKVGQTVALTSIDVVSICNTLVSCRSL